MTPKWHWKLQCQIKVSNICSENPGEKEKARKQRPPLAIGRIMTMFGFGMNIRVASVWNTVKRVFMTTWEIGTNWELKTPTSVPRSIHYIEMDLRNKTI